MNKQELKRAFGKIRPSRALIEQTVERLNAARLSPQEDVRAARMLTYKLAGAMCALALVLSVGVSVIGQGSVPMETAKRISEGGQPLTAQTPTPLDGDTPPQAVAQLQSKTAPLQQPWIVVYGTVSGCYFSDRAEYKNYCLVQIEQTALYAQQGEAETALPTDNGMVAVIDTAQDSVLFDALLGSMSEPIYLCMVQQELDGVLTWQIVDFEFQK